MAVIKCKMCGGDLQIVEGNSVCECEYCGSKQTVPTADNEKKMTLFTRANRLLRNCEFDKASGVFETIVAEFPEEAEAYWGLVLCKYGIEYVDDPATGKKIPTCHRSSFDSVLDDSNFEQACENTDAIARRVYRDEARAIEELRKNIIEVSGKEDPYDIFISYKETDENGDRTLDSVVAQDIYKELTNDGYRVFFSRISLEDKLGTEYEPYIFAALNSAKVMLVVGTDYENFDAVWVKNEWSRFLKLIASGNKKTLIPVFKNMDAYDMPKEFAKLAAQDMGKVGAMQDLIRGIEKLTGKKKEEVQTETVQVSQGANPTIDSLLDRAFVFLEDQEWEKAAEYAEKVLDLNVRNGKAYLVKLMADLKIKRIEDLAYLNKPFSDHPQYLKIQRFGGEELNKQLDTYLRKIKERNQSLLEQRERERKLQICNEAHEKLNTSASVDQLVRMREKLSRIADFEGVSTILAAYDNRITILRVEEQKQLEHLKELEAHRHEINERAGLLKVEFDRKREQYNIAYSKVNELRKKFAESKMQQVECENRIKESKREIAEVTGFFSGRRRKTLEESIYNDKMKLAKYKKETERWEAQYDAELSNLPEEPQANELSYEIGMLFYQAGFYKEAYKRFAKLGTYRDADLFLASDKNFEEIRSSIERTKELSELGGHIVFGEYENESLIWIVLAKEQNRRLLISEKAIDGRPYDSNNGNVKGWSESSIRTWLNTSFFNCAFNVHEQAAITSTQVSNSSNQADNRHFKRNPTAYDRDTQDKVFLLSYVEAAKYFKKDQRSCKASEYAITQGVTASPNGNCEWWLRSTSNEGKKHVSTVDDHGTFSHNVHYKVCGIRPAVWIDIKAECFNIEL